MLEFFGGEAFCVTFSFFRRATVVVVVVLGVVAGAVQGIVHGVVLVIILVIILGIILVVVLVVVLIIGIIVFFARVVAVTAARTLAILPEDPARRHRGHRPELVWDAYLGALWDILSSPHENTIRDILVISPVCIVSLVVAGVVEQAKPREHV